MHTYVSPLINHKIHILISTGKYKYGEKLQDNFASLSVLYFDQTASVHVTLPGFLERVIHAEC